MSNIWFSWIFSHGIVPSFPQSPQSIGRMIVLVFWGEPPRNLLFWYVQSTARQNFPRWYQLNEPFMKWNDYIFQWVNIFKYAKSVIWVSWLWCNIFGQLIWATKCDLSLFYKIYDLCLRLKWPLVRKFSTFFEINLPIYRWSNQAMFIFLQSRIILFYSNRRKPLNISAWVFVSKSAKL